MHCYGYTDRFSALPGELLSFHLSASAPAVDVDFVRLIHGDANPAGPGVREHATALGAEGTYAVADQVVTQGSFATVALPGETLASFTVALWMWPTRPAGGQPQGLACRPGAFALELDADGALTLSVAGEPGPRIAPGPRERRWSRVVASHDAETGATTLQLISSAWPPVRVCERAEHAGVPAVGADLLIAAGALVSRTGRAAEHHYNGKLDGISLWRAAVEPQDAAPSDLVAAWDLGAGGAGGVLSDTGPRGLHGRVHHLPRRPVTGHRFDGTVTERDRAPDQWTACHFHADDLEDAAWPATFELRLPDDLPSGVYAARARAGTAVDRIPFFVRPRRGGPTAAVAVLFPTISYLSYANERMQHKDFVREPGVLGQLIVPDAGDLLLAEHPDLGSSLYDRHLDGDGVCFSSSRRPILNMRPGHRNWQTHAPRGFSADLYLVDWLMHERVPHDTITDHDLHAEGRPLLDPYAVVITGCHPEYWTAAMWDGLRTWLDRGGRLMYLGGNGFYWVTSVDPARPHVIEVQRGTCGIRCWESAAGETAHVTTGEPGGLWRNRGRSPNALVGVGFAAQGFDDHAPGFRRLPASWDPAVAFAFEGIDEEVIGDFGLAMGGAAGDEIDRHDPRYGSPPEALVLATSQGAHSDYVMLVCEDVPVTHPNLGGSTCPDVRADITLMPTAAGGAVFSTSSIAWTASLSWRGYENNVARLSGNVLRRFLDPQPMVLGAGSAAAGDGVASTTTGGTR